MLLYFLIDRLVLYILCGCDFKHIIQVRMYHEAIVVIPMKFRPIAVNAIAFVPCLMSFSRVINPFNFMRLIYGDEKSLYHRGKQQPVVFWWFYFPGLKKAGYLVSPYRRAQCCPYFGAA